MVAEQSGFAREGAGACAVDDLMVEDAVIFPVTVDFVTEVTSETWDDWIVE